MSTPDKRQKQSYRLRKDLAAYYRTIPTPAHISNGDDARYATQNYFASFTKGLPHDTFGEVDTAAYETLLNALESGQPADFAAVPLGTPDPAKRYPLVDPQAGLAFDLEGPDSHLLTIPPAYAFGSPGAMDEIAENYWLALCRDIPFADYHKLNTKNTDPLNPAQSLTQAAADDLNTYAVFDGPMAGGQVTIDTLFRGNCPGDLLGPYISQFLLLDIPYGVEKIHQKVAFAVPEKDYMTTTDSWLKVQKGSKPEADDATVKVLPVHAPTYMYRGRDLAQYVHIDELFQAYLNACLLLITPKDRGGMGAALNPGNPYPGSNQMGFGTLGEPNFKVIVAEVATRALKAIWFQKWFVHRRQRPEVFAGRIHHNMAGTPGVRSYPFDRTEFMKLGAQFASPADPLPAEGARPGSLLDHVFQYNAGVPANSGHGSYLLPMAFPEGSPIHPAYGAGHATVAGACVTILKALFDDQQPIELLVQNAGHPGVVEPNSHGTHLNNYVASGGGGATVSRQAQVDQMTVGTELDKLAANIGIARNFAGVHWRSDYTASLSLGEQVAVHFLRETIRTYNEDVYFTFTRFDGTRITITKSGVY